MPDNPDTMPDWRDPQLGARVRIALWLAAEIGEGNEFTMTDLADAVPGHTVDILGRRIRDLGKAGWIVHGPRNRASLTGHRRLLVRVGSPVWEPAHRADGLDTDITAASTATAEQVWQAMQELSDRDKVALLTWMINGQRTPTPAEIVFAQTRRLTAGERKELQTRLLGLLTD